MVAPALTFGPLNLIGTDAEIVANGYKLSTQATDTDWGNAVPVIQRLKSWLQDGTLAKLRGYDNREMNVQIRVTAATLPGLAKGSKELELQCHRPNLLTYTPPGAGADPCVFVIVTSHLDHAFDDLNERRLIRVFNLRIEARPFVRSSILTTVSRPAPTGTQVITTVDDCSSFTNWAATGGGVPSGGASISSGAGFGAVNATATSFSFPSYGVYRLRLTRSSLAASITTTPYVRVIVQRAVSGMGLGPLTFKINNVVVAVAVQEGDSYWLDTTGLGLGSTMNSLIVESIYGRVVGETPTSASLSILDVARSNVLGTQGTGRMLSRTIPVAGSERTEGILEISDATDALGDVLVYTCNAVDGMAQPNLRQFLTSGNTETADGTTVSGKTSDLFDPHTFDIPVDQVPEGGYSLVIRVKKAIFGTLDNTITWSARSRMGSTNDVGQSGTVAITLDNGTDYQFFTIDILDLPTSLMGSDGFVRIELTSATGPSTGPLILDDAYIFNLDIGDLSWVPCGTGTPATGGPAKHLWLDAATLDNPNRAIYIGNATDRSDAMFIDGNLLESFGNHEIVPEAVNVFTVTTGSTASLLELSHYACFGSYVYDAA